MTVGDDIKEAFVEVGTAYNINRRNSSVISGEFLVYDISVQFMNPLAREFQFQASMSYDTQARAGDILEFDDGRKFILCTEIPDQFNNEAVVYESTLLKCNVCGSVARSSGEAWGEDYHKVQSWHTIESLVDAAYFPYYQGNMLEEYKEFGDITVQKILLYVSKDIDIQPLDRFYVSSGEYYKVDVVKKRMYPGYLFCEVSEDTRE